MGRLIDSDDVEKLLIARYEGEEYIRADIRKIPTAKTENRWIPVEERLPDKPGDYWVAMRHLDGSITTEKMFWRPEWPHEDAWKEVVVAWQPYYCPEPFVPQNCNLTD